MEAQAQYHTSCSICGFKKTFNTMDEAYEEGKRHGYGPGSVMCRKGSSTTFLIRCKEEDYVAR